MLPEQRAERTSLPRAQHRLVLACTTIGAPLRPISFQRTSTHGSAPAARSFGPRFAQDVANPVGARGRLCARTIPWWSRQRRRRGRRSSGACIVRIAIVGGGIGGLTTALALRQAGLDAHVYEQATVLR